MYRDQVTLLNPLWCIGLLSLRGRDSNPQQTDKQIAQAVGAPQGISVISQAAEADSGSASAAGARTCVPVTISSSATAAANLAALDVHRGPRLDATDSGLEDIPHLVPIALKACEMLPYHATHDGRRYLSPSAIVWQNLTAYQISEP